MKHLTLAAVAILLVGTGASAQVTLLKEAERAMKGQSSFADVEKMITPAFTNSETKGVAQTYYIPGKAAFNEYDAMIVKRQLGQVDEKGINTMVNDLLQGYNYFMKALPLDSLPDEKGKVKPKYSKDIFNILAGHYGDYNNVAIDAWNAENYQGSYDAWGIILDLPNNPNFVKAIPATALFADTLLAELAFNRALAAFQAGKYDNSLASFYDAKDRGFSKKTLYDYAMAAADRAGKPEEVVKWAKMAIPVFGNEDDNYIRMVINQQLTDGKFDEALTSINEAIANDPNNSQYQWVLGIIYTSRKEDLKREMSNAESVDASDPRLAECDKLHQQAKDAFQKAIELNPKNDNAYVALGSLTYEDGEALDNLTPVGSAETSAAYFNEKVVPVFRKAAEFYEQAVSINPENRDALQSLETVYYRLGDEANMERVKALRDAL